jgi:hypothetical protein
MRYVELRDTPPDPNRARYYAILLSLVAALIAVMTLKTNYDYFRQYYEGFGFWMRLIPFYSVEATVIGLPLVKGWGNHSQWRAAKLFEVGLIVMALVHTSLVGQADQAKKQAAKTKSEARVDYDRSQAAASQIAAQNKQLQEGYDRAMSSWRRAANAARWNRQPAPPPPQAPQLLSLPKIDQSLLNNATLSVEQVAEAEVNHKTLLRLLYLMIGGVVGTALTMVSLSDSSRVKAWLLKRRAAEIRQMTEIPPTVVDMSGYLLSAQRRPAGFVTPNQVSAGSLSFNRQGHGSLGNP